MMRALATSLTIAACLAFARQAPAGGCGGSPQCCGAPDCCADCGGCGPCQKKVCQVVCGTKTITKHCWCVECEEFCAPLPGCCPTCKTVTCDVPTCDGTGCCEGCCDPCGGQKSCYGVPMAVPKCGPVRCRKVLVKKEYECEVPVYKCVVKYVCPGCCAGEEEGVPDVQPESAPPPPPAPSKDARHPAAPSKDARHPAAPMPWLYGIR